MKHIVKLRHEQGYALVLVLFIVLLLTILGTTILASSIGGAVRTETRENHEQSLHLAEKALNEAAAYLIATYDGRTDISAENMDAIIAAVVNQLNNKQIATELSVDHSAWSHITSASYTKKNDAHFEITITAEAEVNGAKRSLQQIIQFDAYPEFLKYAYGSEGDVIINGSPYAIGNLYAGGDLKINDVAQYSYKTAAIRTKQSHYPVLDQGEIYVSDLDHVQYYALNSYSSIRNNINKIEDLLAISADQIKLRPKSKFISVNVEGSFIEKLTEAARLPQQSSIIRSLFGSETAGYQFNASAISQALQYVQQNNPQTSIITPLQMPELPARPAGMSDEEYGELLADYQAQLSQFYSYLTPFRSELTQTTIFNGDLTLDGLQYEGITFADTAREKNWFIVNGDLTIENLNTSPLQLFGNILVMGNVAIYGEAEVDATIIALGVDTTLGQTIIQDAKLQGRYVNGRNKQLVLMASDTILVNRVAAFDNPGRFDATNSGNVLDAFFYTDASAELYGVGSTLWLHGGFFAKEKLTINAIRGSVDRNADDSDIIVTSTGFLDRYDARLIIQYNVKVFEDQYTGLPRVKKISVAVGKKKLIP